MTARPVLELHSHLLSTDERDGRSVADTEGVETTGTATLLGEAVRDGRLSSNEAIEVLDAMIDAGWYCSTDRYSRIVQWFRELGRNE